MGRAVFPDDGDDEEDDPWAVEEVRIPVEMAADGHHAFRVWSDDDDDVDDARASGAVPGSIPLERTLREASATETEIETAVLRGLSDAKARVRRGAGRAATDAAERRDAPKTPEKGEAEATVAVRLRRAGKDRTRNRRRRRRVVRRKRRVVRRKRGGEARRVRRAGRALDPRGGRGGDARSARRARRRPCSAPARRRRELLKRARASVSSSVSFLPARTPRTWRRTWTRRTRHPMTPGRMPRMETPRMERREERTSFLRAGSSRPRRTSAAYRAAFRATRTTRRVGWRRRRRVPSWMRSAVTPTRCPSPAGRASRASPSGRFAILERPVRPPLPRRVRAARPGSFAVGARAVGGRARSGEQLRHRGEAHGRCQRPRGRGIFPRARRAGGRAGLVLLLPRGARRGDAVQGPSAGGEAGLRRAQLGGRGAAFARRTGEAAHRWR